LAVTINNMVLQVETEDLKLKQVVGTGTEQVVVEAELEVPKEKPDIEEVLKVEVKIKPHAKIRVINDKVIIDGNLEVNTLYVGDTKEGDQPVHHMEHDLKFASYVDVKGTEECMEADVDIDVENVDWDLIEACKLRISIVLEITVKVTEISEVEVVTDMKLVPPGTQPTPTKATIPATTPIEGGPITNNAGNTGVVVAGISETRYTVVAKDTLGHIAQRFGTTVEAIARANNLTDIHRLSIGQILLIPGRTN